MFRVGNRDLDQLFQLTRRVDNRLRRAAPALSFAETRPNKSAKVVLFARKGLTQQAGTKHQVLLHQTSQPDSASVEAPEDVLNFEVTLMTHIVHIQKLSRLIHPLARARTAHVCHRFSNHLPHCQMVRLHLPDHFAEHCLFFQGFWFLGCENAQKGFLVEAAYLLERTTILLKRKGERLELLDSLGKLWWQVRSQELCRR
mmetsp:Transcript_32395/g.78966  ORF Transcript_32395/g.78966 Transcript_32395/m.78966 type:complete len:200 (+) Transcript_32395:2901-3500(+)